MEVAPEVDITMEVVAVITRATIREAAVEAMVEITMTAMATVSAVSFVRP